MTITLTSQVKTWQKGQIVLVDGVFAEVVETWQESWEVDDNGAICEPLPEDQQAVYREAREKKLERQAIVDSAFTAKKSAWTKLLALHSEMGHFDKAELWKNSPNATVFVFPDLQINYKGEIWIDGKCSQFFAWDENCVANLQIFYVIDYCYYLLKFPDEESLKAAIALISQEGRASSITQIRG